MSNGNSETILYCFNLFNVFKKKMKGFLNVEMTTTEVGALHFINKKGKATMKELSDFLEITPPSTTVLIDKMIKLGILERSINKDDRRNVMLAFTKKGEEMFKKGEIEKNKIIKKVSSCLTEKERVELHLIFQKLIKELCLKNKD